MDTRKSRFYNFLKKCEEPPKDNFFWSSVNLLFNMALIFLGRRIIRKSFPRTDTHHGYLINSTKNMGDLAVLYRVIDEIIRINDFESLTIIADPMFKHCFEALKDENVIYLPFWKIMAMDKAVQVYAGEYPHIVMSTAWLFFGTEEIYAHSPLKSLPCEISPDDVADIFSLNEMKGKTVILSPYEQTISYYGYPALPKSFWSRLAEELKAHGYYVFTNCNGKDEMPVAGTEQFFPKVKDLAGAVQYAGYCVSIRSGFTDWVSSAKLKKEVVLYPNRKYFEYYSIGVIWKKIELFEYIYDDNACDEVLNTIMKYILD